MNELNRNDWSVSTGFKQGDRVRPKTEMTIPLERYRRGEDVLEGSICIRPSHTGIVVHDPRNTTSTVAVVNFDFKDEGIEIPGGLYIPCSRLTKVCAEDRVS